MQFISGFSDGDHFSTHVGVSGLLSVNKLRLAHIVLNDLTVFQNHLKKVKPANPTCEKHFGVVDIFSGWALTFSSPAVFEESLILRWRDESFFFFFFFF